MVHKFMSDKQISKSAIPILQIIKTETKSEVSCPVFFLGVSPCNHISFGFLVGVGKDNGHIKIKCTIW